MNPHVVAFVKRLERKFAIDSADMTNSDWIEANTKLNEKPFSFKGYEFQRQIANDEHPNMDVIKASQTGLTETQVRKALCWVKRNAGATAIFTLPNEKMYKRVSQTRIQPLIEKNQVFNPEGEKNIRSMGLMQFGHSFLYVTGATEGDATSIPADAIFNDEVDLTDQEMLALFNSRLQNSRFKIRQRFSTPTFTGYGIHLGYEASDQHEYMCKCLACNHWNIPDFEEQFVHIPGMPDDIGLLDIDDGIVTKLNLDAAYVKCERCGAPLDLDNPEIREWVPRFAERTHARGYYVRPFVTSRIPPKYIITQLLDYRRRSFLRGFYNTVLGRPYIDGNARLSVEDIKANLHSPSIHKLSKEDPCYLGIDVGQTCNITIGAPTDQGIIRVVQFTEVIADNLVNWVQDFCKSHNVIGGAIDRHPYTPTANAVFDVSEGRIWPVEYRGSKEINPVKNVEGDVTHFQANRTMLIDEVVKRIRRRQLPMQGYGAYEHVVIEHLRDMVRDEQPEKEAEWKKLNGNDHYFHSLGFLLFSLKIMHTLEVISGAEVRTMYGFDGVDQPMLNNGLVGFSPKRKDIIYSQGGSLLSFR